MRQILMIVSASLVLFNCSCGSNNISNNRAQDQSADTDLDRPKVEMSGLSISPIDESASGVIVSEDFNSGTWTNTMDTYYSDSTSLRPVTTPWSVSGGRLQSGKVTSAQGTMASVALFKMAMPVSGYSMQVDAGFMGVIQWLGGVLTFPSVTFGFVTRTKHFIFSLNKSGSTKSIDGVTHSAVYCELYGTAPVVKPDLSNLYTFKTANVCGYVPQNGGIPTLRITVQDKEFVGEVLGAKLPNPLRVTLPRSAMEGRIGAIKRGDNSWDNFVVRKLK